MKRFVWFTILFCYSILLKAQLFYPADSIPVYLRAGAKAVIRTSQIKIDIQDEKHSNLLFKTAITLLNEDAADMTLVQIPYYNLRSISNIKGAVYNESGRLVWTLKSFDIYDMKEFSGPAYLNDERMKVFEFPTYNYPFTIEYSYEMNMEDLFLSPVFHLKTDPEVALEYSGLQYIIPDATGFKYKLLNIKTPTDSFRIGKKLYLSWMEENLPAEKQQFFAPSIQKKLPAVYGTPIKTDLKGYKGSFQTWRDYGMWMNGLLNGRDILDPQYAEAARKLVNGIHDRKEKIKALYEYMQKNTRYFNVSFGIGGKQPIPANQVAQNGYGDCKALSNYMKALLKAVDIESYYTLAYAGEVEDIQYDFPCNQFNHAILCVPDGKDTIWLECTDQTSPFNYLGSFTCDRHVLAITPDGGKILKTPEYGRNYNSVRTVSNISIRSSGDADIKIEFLHAGLQFDELYALSESKADDRKEWLADQFGNNTFEINKEEYSFEKSALIPNGKAEYEIFLRDLASKSQGRLFVSPCLITSAPYIWDDPSDIEIDYDLQSGDSVRIEIPAGYKIEFIPPSKQLNSKFGNYTSRIFTDDKNIFYVRKIILNKATYPKELFSEFYNFITEIAAAERQMLVLKEL